MSKETKHTPGPWNSALQRAAVRALYPDAIVQKGARFGYCNADNPPAWFWFDSWDEAADDLAQELDITTKECATQAAAPELAEAGRDVIKSGKNSARLRPDENSDVVISGPAWNALRAALAKAGIVS